MWQHDEEFSGVENSDDPDSDIEALLYSKIHYEPAAETDSEFVVRESAPAVSCATPSTTPKQQRKRRTKKRRRAVEELKGVAGSPNKKERREVVTVVEGAEHGSDDEETRSLALEDEIVLSSDDEVILFSEESHDLNLNVLGTSQQKEGQEDLWRVDLADKYRINRGFRYHNQFSGVRCRNCNESGHLSKVCPQPKVQVCHLCSEPGHQHGRCPKRICARCYRTGHILAECHQNFTHTCDICGIWGHPGSLCPDLWRRYHLTTEDGPIVRAPFKTRPLMERYCFNCAAQGHYGHECDRKRRGTLSTPYIISYDDPSDVYHGRRRQRTDSPKRRRENEEKCTREHDNRKAANKGRNRRDRAEDPSTSNNRKSNNRAQEEKSNRNRKKKAEKKARNRLAKEKARQTKAREDAQGRHHNNLGNAGRRHKKGKEMVLVPAWDYRSMSTYRRAVNNSNYLPYGW